MQQAAHPHASFTEIVREHQSMVLSLAYHFLHDHGLAEELAQEVFLSLYQNLASIKSPEHLKFWLRKVTSHRCIDYIRRQKFGLHLQMSIDDVPEIIDAFRVPDDLPDPMLSQKLRRYVAALPEKQRIVVVLRYQEDLDPTEIAEVLEMPVNTVKSYLQRSLVTLREKLSRCLGEVNV
ncbi:MAG TPA: sigma-70 family RNA polymerase sigma factor [Blastocatellia bacterium]|nr:sigma-70 family RNA polymerase sigma factor [Blastocatellia bacterium]